MTTWLSLVHSVLSRCFSSFRSVMCILHTFSCNTPHAVITGFNSGKFVGHSWGGINSGVSSCNNPTVSHVRWAFQVSQGSVGKKDIIQVSWKTFILFRTKFIQESPEFCRRYYIKHFGLFLLDTLYIFFFTPKLKTNSQIIFWKLNYCKSTKSRTAAIQ